MEVNVSFIVITFHFFLDVSFNIAELLRNRPSIPNFQEHHPEEGLLEVFLNPTSIIANDRTTIGNIIDIDFKTEDINYELYTKDNKEQPVFLRVGDATQLKDSPFNSEWPTKIIIHGWAESGNAFWLHDIRRNYLNVGDYNVICVDWFAGSTKEYLTSVKLTHQVSKMHILKIVESVKRIKL